MMSQLPDIICLAVLLISFCPKRDKSVEVLLILLNRQLSILLMELKHFYVCLPQYFSDLML